MTRHEELVVERLRADHVRIPGQRRVCALCGQRMPCDHLVLAADIEAGRRDVDGNLIIAVLPLRELVRQGWPYFLLCVMLALFFGWPGPELLS